MSTTDTRAAFEAWVRKECDFCLDWAGNDPFDHNHTMDAWAAWQAATEAAKATGTAGELPPLPEPVTYMIRWPCCTSGLTESVYETALSQAMKCSPGTAVVELCTFDQMREYGQACAEAARQPAPVVAMDESWLVQQILLFRGNGRPIDKESAERCARTIMAKFAATNRSQP